MTAAATPPRLDAEVLAISAGDYRVAFRVKAAYTLGNVTFQGAPILLITGANQTVVNVVRAEQSGEDPWFGTAHGREEIVSLALEVDGQSFPIDSTFNAPEGDNYTLRKVSRLGPFEATTVVTVNASGIDQRVSFKPVESDLVPRYAYVFMHCLSPTFHDWQAVNAEGEVFADRFPDERINSLKRDVVRLSLYDESRKVGVTLIYPEQYEGTPKVANMLINWPERHYKHYLQVAPERLVEREYRCKLVAFPANSDDWQKLAAEVSL